MRTFIYWLVLNLAMALPAVAAETRLVDIEANLRGKPEQAAPALLALAETQPPGSAQRIETLFVRGVVLVRLGHAEPVEEAAQALASGAPPGTPAGALAAAVAQALRAQWLSRHGSLGAADRQMADAKAAIAALPAPPPPSLRLRMLLVQARIKESRGQLDAAVALHQEAVLLVDTQGPAWRRAEVRSGLAYALVQAQQLPAARAVDAEAMTLARESGDMLALSQVLTISGILRGAAGESGPELQAMEGAIEAARQAGARRDELLGLANLADYYLKHGDYVTALRLSREALPLARAARDPIIESVALTNAGLALISLKQRDAGLALVRESLLLEERAGGLTAMAQIQREAGLYLERAGFLPEAWAAFTEHRRVADEVFRREHQQALLETQAAFDHERRQRDLALLATEKGLGEAQLESRILQQRLWAMGAVAGVLLLAVVGLLLRRLWRSNRALSQSNRLLLQASEHDPLTGLANRRHLQRVMAAQAGSATATPGARSAPATAQDSEPPPAQASAAAPATQALNGSLLLIDIDHFKRINDDHGHATGDAVLVAVAQRLRAALRDDDLVVRWGGEEFLVLVRDLPAERVEKLAQRLLEAIGGQPVAHGAGTIAVTASIGFATFPLPPDAQPIPWERAVDLVDTAMYLAKAHGRNRAWGVRRLQMGGDALAPDTAVQQAGPPVATAPAAALQPPPAGAGAPGPTDTLEAAWRAGRAELSQHPGPQRQIAPASPAATLSAAALLLAGALTLASGDAPAQTARPDPGRAGLAALHAQAESQVDIGYDRPDAALAVLARWQQGPEPGSDGWQVLQTAQGLVLARAGRHAEAEEVARRLASVGRGPLAAADAALVQAASLDAAGRARDSHARAEQALAGYKAACSAAPAPPACNHRHIWRAQHTLARLLLTQGQNSLAREQAQAAAALARQQGDSERQAMALATASRASELLGERDLADQLFEQAQRLARLEGRPALRARIALVETVHRESRGDTQGSLRAAELGLPWARRAQSPRLEAMLLANLSDSYLHTGKPRLALQAVARALPVMRAHGDRRAERILLVNASLARIGLGELAAARASLEELEVAFRDAGASADQAQLLREFSNALAAAGDLQGALELYHREREVAASVMAANRDTALAVLRERFDREAQQRQLDQLTRENALIATQLANRTAQQRLWGAAALVLVLVAAVAVLVYGRVRQLNQRLARNHARLRLQSQRDPLTGLANRRALAERLPAECHGGLLLVDIDHFKRINDSHGHAGGDAVLVTIARRLQACVRDEDLVVRWGGEEFLIHAPGLNEADTAALAQRLLHAVAATPVTLDNGARLDVTASLGHGSFPLPQAPGPMPLERAVNLADMALYTAKNQGRDRAISVVEALAQEAQEPRTSVLQALPQ